MASLNLPSIAFPEQIGCGLAGGDWGAYERMLEEFADANPDVRVKGATPLSAAQLSPSYCYLMAQLLLSYLLLSSCQSIAALTSGYCFFSFIIIS